MSISGMKWRPEYSDVFVGATPSSSLCSTVKTLAAGSLHAVSLRCHHWSDTSNHLLILIDTRTYLAIPAEIVGKLLLWLRDMSRPPNHPWDEVEFWIHRTELDVWVWFKEESPEAMSYLPWKHVEAERVVDLVTST